LNRLRLRASGALLVVAATIAVAAFLFISGSPTKALAYGNGDGTSNTHTVIGTPVPFSQLYSTQVQGDYVAAGVGMRASGPPGGGTITLGAVPGGSTIAKAFLYWSVINSTSLASLGQGSINGHAITGTNYGTTASPCWDVPNPRQIYAFVADVTAYATFGANTLTGFASGGPPTFPGTEPLLEGATLVVIYQNTASPAHQVDLYQGARTFDGPPVETLTMSGYSAVSGNSKTTWVVSDGQPNSPPFNNKTYVDGSVTMAGTLNGADGNFWDTNTQDVTANIPPGDTSIQVGTESSFDFGSGDCITWVGQFLSTPINATTFTVNKVYSPSGPMASVPVSVNCSSGAFAPSSGTSSPASPFTTTDIGFIMPATCSASETTVPPGYIESDNCSSVSLANNVPASCTLTNTETSTTFTVHKVYSPAGPVTAVPVSVTCTSGIVATPSGSASPPTPFTTVVHQFNVSGTTCSASETVPSGYTMTSDCTGVPISNGAAASCTITNTLVTPSPTVIPATFTPNPSAVGGLVELASGGDTGGGAAFPIALLALIGAAFVAATGGTFAFVRTRR